MNFITGHVGPYGEKIAGTGFSVERVDEGSYDIYPDKPSGNIVVVASAATGAGNPPVKRTATVHVEHNKISVRTSQNDDFIDSNFHFIASL